VSPRVLLLGADGFLGRHIGRALEGLPGEPVTLVRHARVGAAGSDGERLALDLLVADADALAQLVDRAAPDVVVNAVGVLDGPPAAMAALNADLPARLADLCAARTTATRLVHIASSAEYGATAFGTSVTEDAPNEPVSEYGRTKLAGTRAVLDRVATGARVDACVLRVFNPVGAGSAPSSLLGRAARALRSALAAGDRAIAFGPLGAYRDFVDARDVAEAVALAALTEAIDPPLLNVGSGHATQARDAVHQLAAIAGFGGEISEQAAPSGRSAGVDWQQADLSRTRSALGWGPRRTLADALEALWGDT
jgi:nucleoside-diphosphate-sugar epimerase